MEPFDEIELLKVMAGGVLAMFAFAFVLRKVLR